MMSHPYRTVLEISDTHIKLLQAESSRKQSMMSVCQVRSIAHLSQDAKIKVVKELLRLKSIKSESIIVVIPRAYVIVKIMRLPSENDEEIKKMISLQLMDQIPYGLDDVLYEYVILDKDDSGFASVAVVVLPKKIYDEKLSFLEKTGIKALKYSLSSLGIFQWQLFHASKDPASDAASLAIVSLDLHHMEICIKEKNRFVFSRMIPVGGVDLSTENLDRVVSQIKITLSNYRKEQKVVAVQRLLVIVEKQNVVELKEKLAQELALPVDVTSSLKHVPCDRKIDLDSLRAQHGVSLASALGILLPINKNDLCFPALRLKVEQSRPFVSRELIRLMVLFVVMIALVSAFPFLEILKRQKTIQQLDEKIQKISLDVNKSEDKIKAFGVIKTELTHRIFITDLIAELYRITPQNISFQNLSLDKDGLLTIHGYANDSLLVNTLQDKLLASTMFKDINLQSATKRRLFDQDFIDFQLTSKLKRSL